MNWNRRFFLLLASVTALRLIYVFVSPLDLVADEAYYWDWSRQLDWGYFSKPPLIAWIIALFTRTFGSTAPIVRLPAVLLGMLGTMAVFLLARRMYDSRTAFWAAAAGMASPGASALGFLMTIDAPLVCFWSIALYLFWRVLGEEKGRLPEWFGLAAAIGLGLLDKQMMAVFIALIFIFLAVSGRDRHLLKSCRPYLFSLLAFAGLIPPIVWNAHHGWITLHHTATHFVGTSLSPFITVAEYIGGQIMVVSPVTWILFSLVSILLVFRIGNRDRRELYLLCFSTLSLFVFFGMSFRQRMQPNWPAAFYPGAMILVSAWACGNISAGSGLDSWRPLFKKGVIIGAVMALLTYALPFWAAAAPLSWGKNLVARLQGWRQLGVELGKTLDRAPRPASTFILTFNRQLTSELAFYVPGQPRVYVWREPGSGIESEYDLWSGPEAGRDALIITHEGDTSIPAAMSGFFQSVERLENTSLEKGEREKYWLYLGTFLKEWPSAPLPQNDRNPSSACLLKRNPAP